MKKERSLRHLVLTLLLAGAVSVGASGCLLVPFPVWDGGGHHHHHGR